MFIPHHVPIAAGGAAPTRWMLVLHGIYGSGANWRTFARKLVVRRPEWGMVLVDLRMHGQSRPAPPPHTVARAASDLAALTRALNAQGKPVRAICGHSFGGKVALHYRAHSHDRAEPLAHTWVIDASPSARPRAMAAPNNVVTRVLAMLSELPERFTSRDEFVQAVSQHGFPAPLGHWLAMNLERQGDGYVSRLEPAAMDQLLTDYYQLDSWPSLRDGSGQVHVVIAGKSTALDQDDQARLDALVQSGARVRVTRIEQSGHWVHIDAPEALLDTIASGLVE